MNNEVLIFLSISCIAIIAFYFSKYEVTFTEEED